VLRQINKQELGRKTWRLLAAIRGNNGTQSKLDRLEIPASWPAPHSYIESITQLSDPKQCNEWITITDPKAIEYYLLLRNRLHFGQAQGTPMTEEPLSADFDWGTSTDGMISTRGIFERVIVCRSHRRLGVKDNLVLSFHRQSSSCAIHSFPSRVQT
jgi:hypothetical protein